MSARSYALPSEALTDATDKNPLHPDLTKDSLKLCMYVAMGGASGEVGGRDKVIARTKVLRDFFQIPFDDDVWALVMAYVYNFRFFHTYDARKAAEDGIAQDAKDGDRYYISIMAKSPTASGHAIYAEKENGKLSFRDNECTKTDSINTKFSDNNFMVYKGNKGELKDFDIGVKIAHMPQSMVTTIAWARSLYKDVKIDEQPYKALDVHGKTEEWQEKLRVKLYSKSDLKYDELKQILNGIEGWDASMPKAQ
jgi:hypothetical protein